MFRLLMKPRVVKNICINLKKVKREIDISGNDKDIGFIIKMRNYIC